MKIQLLFAGVMSVADARALAAQECPATGGKYIGTGQFGYNCQYQTSIDGVLLNCPNGILTQENCSCNMENGSETNYEPQTENPGGLLGWQPNCVDPATPTCENGGDYIGTGPNGFNCRYGPNGAGIYMNCLNSLDLQGCTCNVQEGTVAPGYSPQTTGSNPGCVADQPQCPNDGTFVSNGQFGYTCRYGPNGEGIYLNCKSGVINDGHCVCSQENGDHAYQYIPQYGANPTCVARSNKCPGQGATVVSIGQFGYNCQYPANSDGVRLNCSNGKNCECDYDNGTPALDYIPNWTTSPTTCQKKLLQ